MKPKLILDGGICALSVKEKTKDIVSICLTDFVGNQRVLFDTVENKILFPRQFNIKSKDLIALTDLVKETNLR